MNHARFLVAQLGARMHYAVPRILHEAGRLDSFFTDISANQGVIRVLKALPKQLRKGGLARLLARQPKGVPNELIHSFPLLGLEYARRLKAARSNEETMGAYLWMGKTFGEKVLRNAGSTWTAAYVFNSAGLQVLEACRANGFPGYLEQCSSPRLKELKLLRDEAQRRPEWGSSPEVSEGDLAYAEVERKEWTAASDIICPSEFVREGLIAEGADPKKIHMLPYGVDLPEAIVSRDRPDDKERHANGGGSPLRILVAGKVCLQKGSHYVYEAAALLGRKAQFRMVGSVAGLPENVLMQLRNRLEVLGPVPRSAMSEHYSWANVFLLPSLCEGSATVTYEAMAQGLPVICTANTGSVVRDGIEGFIVPSCDSISIVRRIEELANDVELRAEMAVNAQARAAEFTVAKYGQRLLSVLPS